MPDNLLKIDIPVIVEGKYDKIRLQSVIDGVIITTDGFAIFNKNEKLALLRRLASKRGIIVLTDSDGAGKVIRSYISSAVPKDKIIHLYTPAIQGKEKRKHAPSKAGILGVEGMEAKRLYELFSRFASGEEQIKGREICKTDFFEDGLSGGQNSGVMRDALATAFGLPTGMTANALLAALNILTDYESYKKQVDIIIKKES